MPSNFYDVKPSILNPQPANTDLSNISSAGKAYVAIKGYDSTATYSLNEVVLTVSNNEVKLYQSLANNNTSSLSDTTKWKEVSLGGGAGGEIGDMGFAPLGIDETLNLRRYLNGQVISQSLSPSFTTKVKQAIALFPNLGTTESNWQSEKTLSKLGQCGKFVVDDTEGTIRLPAIVNAQGLLSLSAIGTIKDESLPNITGNVSSLVDRHSGAFLATEVSSAGIAGGSVGKIYDNNFNASRSSSTYQDNAPVQQEAVQYPYYIQIATGVEETLPAIREYEINTPFFFGQSRYFENAPYNASWLASNGSYNASTLYPDFWTQLTGVELNGSLNVGDTIEISGKTYVKRGLPVVLSTGTITDYDFVVNQNDQTFRLPLLNGEEDLDGSVPELISSLLNDYTLPKNGTVRVIGTSATNSRAIVWAFSSSTSDADHAYSAGTLIMASAKGKKGDLVHILSDNCTDVSVYFTPAIGNGTLYYYVGDTVQDASLINAGAVLGQLSNKADVDLSNMNPTQTVKNTIVGWGMPDFSAGVAFTGTITLPCDALVYSYKSGGGNWEGASFTVNGVQISNSAIYSSTSCCYVAKGSNVVATSGSCKYYPLKGVN